MVGYLFGRGFTTGAAVISSVAFYGLYAYITQPERKDDLSIQPSKLMSDPNDILKYGVPDRGLDVKLYVNHALSYDQSKKLPLWVAEHITQADLEGSANRKFSNFKMNPSISAPFSSQNSDFKRSGWSRGHMAPAGDNKYSQVAMDQTFYLSNIVPQDINNNGDFWNRFEVFCRDLTKVYKDVWVITGPLMMPNVEEDGKKYVKYQVIGKNNVAVPTHLYKLITIVLPDEANMSKDNENIAIGAFIVPNQPIPKGHDLGQYQVPLQNLTETAGLRFLSNLGDRVDECKDLCKVTPCTLMSQMKLQLYFIGRRLENATSIQRLEQSWSELDKRNLEPDEYLLEVYKRKKAELGEEKRDGVKTEV